MAVTISRLYDRYADAERAVTALETAGIPHSDISIVANNSDEWFNGGKKDRDRDGVDDRSESAGKGAGIGAGIGGTATAHSRGTGGYRADCCGNASPYRGH